MPLPNHPKGQENTYFPFLDEGQTFQQDQDAAAAARMEDRHRRDIPKPVKPKEPDISPAQQHTYTPKPPDILAPFPDRLHKHNGINYIFVANDHPPGDPDPVQNPAYRSPAATKSTINDALIFAKQLVLALPDTEQRVTIYVIGGTYPEDVTFDSGRIDICGLGARPRIHGITTIAIPGHIMMQNLELYNLTAPALVINPQVDLGEDDPGIILQSLRVKSNGNAFKASARFHAYDSKFFSLKDPNSFTCEVHYDLQWAQGMFAEFFRCEIYAYHSDNGLFRDLPTAALSDTNLYGKFIHKATDSGVFGEKKGAALKITTITPNNASFFPNTQTQKTGVMLRYSMIHGYVLNECWALGHMHCECYGGLIDPTANGTIYSVQRSNSGPPPTLPTDSVTWWYHCQVRAKIIGIHTDFSQQNGSAVNYSQFDFSRHGTDVDFSAQQAFASLPFPKRGNGYVTRVMSTTDCPAWIFGGNGIDRGSIVSVPIGASYTPYYP